MMLRFLALVASALVLVACGGSGGRDGEEPRSLDDVLAALEGLAGEERTARLLELVAEEGGSLELYTSMSPAVVEQVVAAFEGAYDVDVGLYRAASSQVFERLVTEAEAGYHGADAVESSGLEMVALDRAGLLERYESPFEQGLVPGTRHPGWVADRFNTFVVGWNTELVPESERPGSWEELADPAWRGRVSIEAEDVDWFKTLWEHWVETEGKDPAEADRLFAAIAANAVVSSGHTVMAELHAAGEFAVAVNYIHSIENTAAKGAPLAWEPAVEPIFPRPNGVAPLAGAPHPATAILFVDWLLGPGQEILAAANVDPARADVADAPAAQRVFVDVEGLADVQEEWTERYERLLTGAGGGAG